MNKSMVLKNFAIRYEELEKVLIAIETMVMDVSNRLMYKSCFLIK